MKLIARQKIWLTIVIVVNAALWIIPSDVVELIARDRHTLLGRYSYEHFTWNVLALIISALSFYVDWSTGETYKKRWFRVLASLGVFALLLFLADFAIRLTDRSQRYVVRDGLIVHRPPGAAFFRDVHCLPHTFPIAGDDDLPRCVKVCRLQNAVAPQIIAQGVDGIVVKLQNGGHGSRMRVGGFLH